ncbi:ADP-ribosylation factor GTPase-activating protein 3 [Clonorchis sinensis]|uniref:ADP-ribosylation factor GTPase-activating protein 3 n=1 Tax=Clonorchis sinensis TaxID=79923 RepID=A0A8T1M0S8_CLOSI|nr:ADP-ribosylation factor GTPase-activating protein 3 [Clonorchis sinensis]
MSTGNQPTKHEISTVLAKLKSLPCNKQCFDCGGSNPTWASVTYGVFLCIDCSAVHRSLGVHLSFIRSTQLDTNWTWVQLRAMQVGGNENARSFFSQHNCRTTDAQEKYQSRAAELYRTKLEKLALNAMKLYGTKESTEPQTAKESDFFQEHTSVGITDFVSGAALSNTQRDKDILRPGDVAEKAGPNVHDGTAPSLSADRPSVIGSRKPRTAKAAGAKKGGLGASKVKTDFAAIESAAENADLQKERQVESANKLAQEQLEKEAERIASLRLAYKEVVEERDKRETALKSVDPKRAEQVERLGMSGANLNTRTGIGHSAFSNVQKIEQEGVTPTSAINANRSSAITSSNMDPYFSSTGFGPSNRILDSYGGSSQSKADDLFGRQPKSSASSWLDEWTVIKSPNEPAARLDDFNDRSSGDRTYFTGSQDNGVTSDWSRSAPSKPRPDPISSRQEASSEQSEALRTKFANATAISSDTYFGRTEPGDLDISRFQGSSSISSDDYFGRARPQQSFQISDEMQSIKDGVRQGVTKVATRLSSLASGVVTSLQDRLG